MILGIDKGTTFTKSSEGRIIRSTVKKFDNDILLDHKLLVEFEGQKYIIGEKGNYSTDLMKSQHQNTKLLIYTMIALSSKSNYIRTKLVVGLPIGLYGKQKDSMKRLLDREVNIKVNENNKYIHIDKLEVFPESAGAFYTQAEMNCLILDLGGLSIDTALFEEGKLIKYSTYSMGTMKLYSKIANNLNSRYDLSLTEWDIPKILNEGLMIYGKYIDLGVDHIIKTHTLEIVERIKLEYDIKTLKVLLTGGGSILLESYIKEYIKHCNRFNGQFANAKGFKVIGEALWQ